jgi:phage-related protein
MPRTELRVFREASGDIPLTSWRTDLLRKNKRAYAKCLALIKVLGDHGRDLDGYYCKQLQSGIYELRARSGNEQHRLLYFFLDGDVVVIADGLQKEKKVPPEAIATAERCKQLAKSDPKTHTLRFEQWVTNNE